MESSQRGNGKGKVVDRNLTTTTKREDLYPSLARCHARCLWHLAWLPPSLGAQHYAMENFYVHHNVKKGNSSQHLVPSGTTGEKPRKH
jgi:hypothetical protein